jgi:hypothetical protein
MTQSSINNLGQSSQRAGRLVLAIPIPLKGIDKTPLLTKLGVRFRVRKDAERSGFFAASDLLVLK